MHQVHELKKIIQEEEVELCFHKLITLFENNLLL